mmetsp:Transcript_18893/g.52014  ORF Transcript_18893/g.52014 Transcript_18893/m.52014 type:complete len:299 (-) Transcript_18893:224-1120(-)
MGGGVHAEAWRRRAQREGGHNPAAAFRGSTAACVVGQGGLPFGPLSLAALAPRLRRGGAATLARGRSRPWSLAGNVGGVGHGTGHLPRGGHRCRSRHVASGRGPRRLHRRVRGDAWASCVDHGWGLREPRWLAQQRWLRREHHASRHRRCTSVAKVRGVGSAVAPRVRQAAGLCAVYDRKAHDSAGFCAGRAPRRTLRIRGGKLGEAIAPGLGRRIRCPQLANVAIVARGRVAPRELRQRRLAAAWWCAWRDPRLAFPLGAHEVLASGAPRRYIVAASAGGRGQCVADVEAAVAGSPW